MEVRNTEHATGAHDANNARDSLIEAPSILTNQFASGGIAISTSAADGLVVSKYGSGGESYLRGSYRAIELSI